MHTPSTLEQPVEETALRNSVYEYQRAYEQWAGSTDQIARGKARLQLQQAQERLWPQIAEAMAAVAKQWFGSTIGRELAPATAQTSFPRSADALDSLAMSMYLYVIEALPQLEVNPDLSLRSCLKQIARRRLIDDERRQKRRLLGHITRPAEPITSTRESAMWFERVRGQGLAFDGEQAEIADPASQNEADAITCRLDRSEVLAAVHHFWKTTLTDDDRAIMRRWDQDPPTTFRELAEQLGAGWTDSMIRQRHHRIMQRTRSYLAEQGYSEP